MNSSKQKLSSILVFFIFLIGFTVFKSDFVKADASIDMNNKGMEVRTATVKTDKVVIVPKRNNENSSKSSNASKSYSRGGRSDIVSYSYNFLGRPYVWGAAGPSAFDCSGFTQYVYAAFGVGLGHYTGSQYQVGQPVKKSELVPGDLVFFNTDGSISHVGMYIGGGQFIHASSGSKKVTISELSGSYYAERYAGARRIIK
ncbi:C40 family peptidase [Clostridium sp. MSJ-11]|uniref:C40 family peptidase n=1 Tax=Clostridium mobile TaxID=2841512 RepID=A0ABS6EEE1_9CLOT|nr:C40 family peptidase [Clostridium mobile]MBU5483576.1 C40 family peptidase [Clostridium mobile]